MAEPISVSSVVRVVARYIRAHPLQQVLAGAALWAPLCVALEISLEQLGVSYPVSVVTKGWGVQVTAAGIAGLTGFLLIAWKTRAVRSTARSKLATARKAKESKEAAALQLAADNRAAAEAQWLYQLETQVKGMTDGMRQYLRTFINKQQKHIEFVNDRPGKVSPDLKRLQSLDWVTLHERWEATDAWISEETFRILIANPGVFGSDAVPTNVRLSPFQY